MSPVLSALVAGLGTAVLSAGASLWVGRSGSPQSTATVAGGAASLVGEVTGFVSELRAEVTELKEAVRELQLRLDVVEAENQAYERLHGPLPTVGDTPGAEPARIYDDR